MFENRVGNPVKSFVGNPCWEPWDSCQEPCLGTLVGNCVWNLVGNPIGNLLLGTLLLGTLLLEPCSEPCFGNPVLGTLSLGTLLGTLFWEPCLANPVVGNPVGNRRESCGRVPHPAPKPLLWLKTPSFQLLGKNT